MRFELPEVVGLLQFLDVAGRRGHLLPIPVHVEPRDAGAVDLQHRPGRAIELRRESGKPGQRHPGCAKRRRGASKVEADIRAASPVCFSRTAPSGPTRRRPRRRCRAVPRARAPGSASRPSRARGPPWPSAPCPRRAAHHAPGAEAAAPPVPAPASMPSTRQRPRDTRRSPTSGARRASGGGIQPMRRRVSGRCAHVQRAPRSPGRARGRRPPAPGSQCATAGLPASRPPRTPSGRRRPSAPANRGGRRTARTRAA